MKTKRNRGFTLVEILIVVVILGILAAIVIPQFSNASQEASINRVKSDLQTMRSQIELYKIQHLGTIPALLTFSAQMTAKTDVTGAVGTDFGPYLQKIPTNPFVATGGNTLSDVAATGGWTYTEATGAIYATQGSCPTAANGGEDLPLL